MGTAERKLREKEQLKELILKAAKEVFLEKGYEDTSIRAIAEKAEYSPGTIYLYFKDKDAILYELKKEGFIILGSRMMDLYEIPDPFERLTAMGQVYVNFALEHQDFYDLMFVIRAPLSILDDKECWMEGQRAFDILISLVDECIKSGRFKGHDVEDLSFVIWSTLHGIVTLINRGRCRVLKEEKQENLEKRSLEAFVRLLSKC